MSVRLAGQVLALLAAAAALWAMQRTTPNYDRLLAGIETRGAPGEFVRGRSVGQKIAVGQARVVKSPHDLAEVQAGDVLVTDKTDPDWEPTMKKAAAIVTNRGGRTCHAAIVAREMGVPAIVGEDPGVDRAVRSDVQHAADRRRIDDVVFGDAAVAAEDDAAVEGRHGFVDQAGSTAP